MKSKTEKKSSKLRLTLFVLLGAGGWAAAIGCGMALGEAQTEISKLRESLTPPPLPDQGDILSLDVHNPRRLAQDFVAQRFTTVGEAAFSADRRSSAVNVNLRPVQGAQTCLVRMIYDQVPGAPNGAWHILTHDCR